jgi:hypothetical protein
MKWGLERCFALSVALAASLNAAELDATITILVYNYAGLPGEVKTQAEKEAERIYQHAGISIGWLDCPLSPEQAALYPACQVLPGPAKLTLRILSQSMAERLRQDQDSFGFALYPEDGSFATVANVFSHDAEELARRRGLSHGVMLGYLMAHELGHLILGVRSHSAIGIMHVPWKKELEIIAQGSMLFTSWEAEWMRTKIQARRATRVAVSNPEP